MKLDYETRLWLRAKVAEMRLERLRQVRLENMTQAQYKYHAERQHRKERAKIKKRRQRGNISEG